MSLGEAPPALIATSKAYEWTMCARTRFENRDKTSDRDGKTMGAFRALRQAYGHHIAPIAVSLERWLRRGDPPDLPDPDARPARPHLSPWSRSPLSAPPEPGGRPATGVRTTRRPSRRFHAYPSGPQGLTRHVLCRGILKGLFLGAASAVPVQWRDGKPCRGVVSSNGNDDFPELAAALQVAVHFHHVVEVECTIDDRPERAAREALDDVFHRDLPSRLVAHH